MSQGILVVINKDLNRIRGEILQEINRTIGKVLINILIKDGIMKRKMKVGIKKFLMINLLRVILMT